MWKRVGTHSVSTENGNNGCPRQINEDRFVIRIAHPNMHAVCAWVYETPAIDLKPGKAKNYVLEQETLCMRNITHEFSV